MRTVADMSRQELEQTLADEIARARAEVRPISRLTLSRLIQSKHSVNPHDAERFVDTYCDEKAPGVPTYLSSEFGVPYLKVLAIANVIVCVALAIVTLVTMTRGGTGFLIWLMLTLAFLAGAAICWINSVRPEKQKPTTRVTTQLPNIGVPADQPEPVTTGTLQSRS